MSLATKIQQVKKVYNIALAASLMAIGLICCSLPIGAAEHCSDANSSADKLGCKLVSHFWSDVQHQDVAGYSRLLAARFQGLNTDGHYDKKEQISGLKDLTVSKFALKHLIAAQYGNTLVVSYDFVAKGQGIVSGPSIDVWQKKSCQWKLVSHSYVPYE